MISTDTCINKRYGRLLKSQSLCYVLVDIESEMQSNNSINTSDIFLKVSSFEDSGESC